MGIHNLLDIRQLHDGTSWFAYVIVSKKIQPLLFSCWEPSSLDLVSDSQLFQQILFNKAVLDQMKFPFPMFLTTWHMIFATFLTQIMSRTTNMLPGVKEV